MRTIITSTHQAAMYFMDAYALKKDVHAHAFPVFKNNELLVCVTETQLAAAVGFLAGRYGVDKAGNHWLLYIFHTSQENKTVFYPHTLVDHSLKAFYPEHLYRHPFVENEWHNHDAASAYQAATQFWPLHQIIFMQVPIGMVPVVDNWFLPVVSETDESLTKAEQLLFENICNNLRLTHAMRTVFNKLCLSYKHRNIELVVVLSSYENEICENKQERALKFEQLRKALCV